MSRHKGYIVVWPVYFDSERSRSEGRKVAKEFSIPNPSLDEIIKALERLNIKYVVEKDKLYPKFWWFYKGRVLVEKRMSKAELLRTIGRTLKDIRAAKIKRK
ncbi:MAG: signal recognition particle protein Srp19 [Thermoprotei archaeon]|nr:signal recognition particle protein Srp19 [Thermoprotei archaeon]